MAKQHFRNRPYNDDYTPENNFHKILFRPDRAIQGRELNGIQSNILNSIEKFGDHIFKHGSIVKDCTTSYDNNVPYVRLNDTSLDIKNIKGRFVVGESTKLKAKIFLIEAKNSVDPDTIYVQYVGKVEGEAAIADATVFADGETLTVLDDYDQTLTTVTVRCPTCKDFPIDEIITPTGLASTFTITSGVYYVFGMFVEFTEQTIILGKYTNKTNYDVGLDIVQEIITSNDDASLLDNALGYPNQVSDGADRYKVSLFLSKKDSDSDMDNFILVAKIIDGNLQEIFDKTQYADIEKMLARRTYDESGDYTVTPFNISFKEFLDDATIIENKNEYTIAKTKFDLEVSTGKAYVRGHEIHKIEPTHITSNKPRETKRVNNAYRYDTGDYIFITLGKNISGDIISSAVPISNIAENSNSTFDFEKVDLYDDYVNNGSTSGNKIGTCRIKTIERHTLPQSHPFTEQVYKLFIFDVQITEKFSKVRGFFKDGTDKFFGNILTDQTIYVDSGIDYPKIYDPRANNLIFELPYEKIKAISNTELVVRKKFYGTTDSNGNFKFGANSNETFPHVDFNKWILGVRNQTLVNYTPVALNSTNLTLFDGKNGQISGLQSNTECVLLCDVAVKDIRHLEKILTDVVYNYQLTPTNKDEKIYIGKTDAYKLKSVIDTDTNIDITNQFKLYPNIFDSYYGISYLKKEFGDEVSQNINIKITVEYFNHVGTGAGTFYSVNSYQTMIESPEFDFEYLDIPTYEASNGTNYNLADVLDFRPDQNSFVVGDEFDTNTFLPSRDTNITFDIDFYLPRIDTLVLTPNGEFRLIQGIAAEEPSKPSLNDEHMPLWDINLASYCYDVSNDISITYYDNRRFTMRDIGDIETRIDNLEYYVTFNQLEKSTAEMTITDENGLNRYKNGFLTDPFDNFSASNLEDREYKCSIDVENGELRPSFKVNNVGLTISESQSSNYKITGDIITSDYDSVPYMVQSASSRTVSVNPYLCFKWIGSLNLQPSMDVWKDVTNKPDITISNKDIGFKDLVKTNKSTRVAWGSWTYGNSSLSRKLKSTKSVVVNNKRRTTKIFELTKSKVISTTKKNKKSLGDRIVDVNMEPWLRSIDVTFIASSMRPNTALSAFFDGVNVTAYCRPLNGNLGDVLKTDKDGGLVGIFTIPNNKNLKFHVGDRVFELKDFTEIEDLQTDDTSYAKAKFWGGGLTIAKERSVIETSVITKQRVTTSTNTSTTTVTQLPPPPAPPPPPPPVIVPPPAPPKIRPPITVKPPKRITPPVIKPPRVPIIKRNPCCAIDENNPLYLRRYVPVDLGKFARPLEKQAWSNASTSMLIKHSEWDNADALTRARIDKRIQWFNILPTMCNPYGWRQENFPKKLSLTIPCAPNAPKYVVWEWLWNSYTALQKQSIFDTLCAKFRRSLLTGDPVAQDFVINEESGVFLTDIDIFFAKKSDNANVWLELRPMENGYPTNTVISSSHVEIRATNVNISNDGNVPTKFKFKHPIYLEGAGKDYCMVIGSSDKAYKVFLSRLGEKDISNGSLISKQPTLFTLFKSQNGRTWNAVQTDDLKFTMNRASFVRDPMVLSFENKSPESVTLEEDPFETEEGSNKIRVFCESHGFKAGDSVNINMFNDKYLNVELRSGNIIAGHPLTIGDKIVLVDSVSASSDFEIDPLDGISKKYMRISIKSLNGIPAPESEISGVTLSEPLPNQESLDSLDISSTIIDNNISTLTAPVAIFKDDLPNEINGIGLDTLLSADHIITAVDSMDSFIIEINGEVASKSGFVGDTGCTLVPNIHYDAIEFIIDDMKLDSYSDIKLTGIGSSSIGSIYNDDYVEQDPIELLDNTTNFLDRPLKIANDLNKDKVLTYDNASLNINVNYTSLEDNDFVSPVIYRDSLSTNLITNRIEWNDVDTFSIAPNATTDGNALVTDYYDPDFNARWQHEYAFIDGSEGSKYITKLVTLQNSANELRIFLDVYSNINTSVEVYYKTLRSEDNHDIGFNDWNLAKRIMQSNNISGSSDEWHEYQYNVGDIGLGDQPLDDFKQFVVKIVLKSRNTAKPPKCKNFRAIAIT